MMSDFKNIYEDQIRAAEYAKLEFPGTYFLAYRDLPRIIKDHVAGDKAIDFGCGTGRSTRVLKEMGFITTGIDNSLNMIKHAKLNDPEGEFMHINNKDFSRLPSNQYDLILSVFTFDNIPGESNKLDYLKIFRQLIKDKGKIILLDSTPEIYVNEWKSFTTKDFPENRYARSGDKVKIIMKDVDDDRPVDDIIWFHDDYLNLINKSDLCVEKFYRPLGNDTDNIKWVNEQNIPPWIIYVLMKSSN